MRGAATVWGAVKRYRSPATNGLHLSELRPRLERGGSIMPPADQSPGSPGQDSHVGPLSALKQLAQIADATKTLIVAVGGIAVAILGIWKDTSWSFAFALIAS